MTNLRFHNSFVQVVFEHVLSKKSKNKLLDALSDPINKTHRQKNITKIFLKQKPQQVIAYIIFEKGCFVIRAFKFGGTDILTGRKKSHVDTIEQILLTKTNDEKEFLY